MIQKNVSLNKLNTFGVEAKAEFFVEVKNLKTLQEVIFWYQDKTMPLMVLGGGSNVLFTKDFPGLVIKNSMEGITREKQTDNFVLIKAMSGELWHELVLWTVENGWGGLENLSLIPGSVGAAPLQNIGAYGVEQVHCFESLEALEIATGNIKKFSLEACQFGYRDSIFKGKEKGKWIIISVTYKLSKNPKLNLEYGVIKKVLADKNIEHPTIQDVSNAVIDIRQSKLPDPKVIGNAGSFFKNPIVKKSIQEAIAKKYPDMPFYKMGPFDVKIPAGWLIEISGFKGKTFGNCGVHKDQALVLVNHNGATGKEIYEISELIINEVKDRFGITLEREVNII